MQPIEQAAITYRDYLLNSKLAQKAEYVITSDCSYDMYFVPQKAIQYISLNIVRNSSNISFGEVIGNVKAVSDNTDDTQSILSGCSDIQLDKTN